MNIFLMRHGSSEANEQRDLTIHVPDHSVNLSALGRRQAFATGIELESYIKNSSSKMTRVWNSSYWRTRQTSDSLCEALETKGINQNTHSDYRFDRKESPLLVEQQFGLFDGYEDHELAGKFPVEHDRFIKNHLYEGRYYARMPMGESRFDVSIRVQQFFGTILRDYEIKGIKNIIIISHGVTLRCFAMMWLHYTPEWLNNETNPNNCSVRLIEGDRGSYTDRGYIIKGFKPEDNASFKI